MNETKSYIVQRRLPGVQGDNGCWSDCGIVDAYNPEHALEQVAGELPDHLLHRDFRVALEPEYVSLYARPEHEHSRTVTVRRPVGA